MVGVVLKGLHQLHLMKVTTNKEGKIEESTNLTILNLWLVWFGPRREDRLATEIVAMQVLCGLLGLFVRHRLALWIFKSDNLIV